MDGWGPIWKKHGHHLNFLTRFSVKIRMKNTSFYDSPRAQLRKGSSTLPIIKPIIRPLWIKRNELILIHNIFSIITQYWIDNMYFIHYKLYSVIAFVNFYIYSNFYQRRLSISLKTLHFHYVCQWPFSFSFDYRCNINASKQLLVWFPIVY